MDALKTGTYSAFFKYLGKEIRFTFAGVTGEPLVVGVSGLNENYTFSFYIMDPDGVRVTFGVYDCFTMKVTPCVYDGTEPNPDDPDDCPTECEVLGAITDPLTVAPCVTDEMAIAMGGSFVQRPAYTVDIINEQVGNAGKTSDLRVLLCVPLCTQLGNVADVDVVANVYDCLTPEAQAALRTFLSMPYLAAIYDTEAEALADDTTTPDDDQAIKVAGRLYQGDGTSTSKTLVEAKVYNPSFTDGAKGFETLHNSTPSLIVPEEL